MQPNQSARHTTVRAAVIVWRMFCCPTCLPTRRGLMASAVAAPLAACGLEPVADPRDTRPDEAWIDSHCHVFNAWDIPIRQFIEKTKLGDRLGRFAAAVPLAAFVAGQRGASMRPDEEIAMLAGQRPEPRRSVQEVLQQQPDQLRDILARDPTPREIEAIAGALGDPTAVRSDKASNRDIGGWFQEMLVFVQWGQRFAKSRYAITQELLQQFPLQAPVLLTPALVDYDRWLGIDARDSDAPASMPSQLEVMAAVGRKLRQDGSPVLILPFVGFCPWRALENLPASLATLRHQLESGLAIGVKLYPPMGFRALGNADSSNIPGFFPPELHAQTADPGAALDEALRGLYALCVELGAPVMAHCGASNQVKRKFSLPAHGNELRADPMWWKLALESFPALRVNLGHFGGVWDFADAGDAIGKQWSRDIVALMASRDGLYADMSYADGLLLDEDLAKATVAHVRALMPPGATLANRLMYGSDWQMVAKEKLGNQYRKRMEQFMRPIFAGERDPARAWENFRWRNAARFLGLGTRGQTRDRLLRTGTPRALLDRFNPDA